MKHLAILTSILLSVVGCIPSASISWSPDGRQGIYVLCRPDQNSVAFAGDGYLIDPDGKVIAELGTVGPSWIREGLTSVAWTDDSKSAYMIAATDSPSDLKLAHDWAADRPVKDEADNYQRTGPEIAGSELSLWDGHKLKPLALLPYRVTAGIELSPDRKWIAITTGRVGRKRVELFAYAIDSGKLYSVDGDVNPKVCFIGAHRLAFVRNQTDAPAGELVATTLDESAAKLRFDRLATDLPAEADNLTAISAGDSTSILFVGKNQKTTAVTQPAAAMTSLYRWDPTTNRITNLASGIDWFSVSPNQKSMLCLSLEGPGGWVELRGIDGSSPRKVARIDLKKLPLWPTWHGNDRITMSEGEPVKFNDRDIFDVSERTIDPQGKLGPATNLTKTWDPERKPWFIDTSKVQ